MCAFLIALMKRETLYNIKITLGKMHHYAFFRWMEACLRESLPSTIEMEENLRNGVYLAKLARFMAPDVLPLNKIYDAEQRKYKAAGLQFRHTDNINHFLRCLEHVQLPLVHVDASRYHIAYMKTFLCIDVIFADLYFIDISTGNNRYIQQEKYATSDILYPCS